MDQEEADEDDDSLNYSVKLEPTKYHMAPKIFGRLSSSKMSESRGPRSPNLSHGRGYIQYQGAELGRITTIFIHEMGGIKRIFFTLIPLHHVMHDRLLNLPILQDNSDNYTIVGLPAVQKGSIA
ncbi:hypothetical protein ACJ73_10202 [Blastomyces percursus]|uniref:Uncharacterized protein n=1 Tax=Blastomyces percursus TaxID=1658174 RepID=A0A1J9NZQ0_9EURO|nr:hypothetical protein ACJ73_10202 [Blastomyces percursus]